MRVDIISLFPEHVLAASRAGVVGRAEQRGLLELAAWNPRDYTTDNYRTVDERPYGGGPGMVMLAEPLRATLRAARAAAVANAPVIYMSPQGPRLTQRKVEQLAAQPGVILLCGRYEGIDERFVQAEVDEELSIGDYVLSGGELAAAVIVDAVTRLIPGVLNDSGSAEQDSFADGLLDCPHWTRPEVDGTESVPAVLLSGDHSAIRRWRRQQSLGRTWLRRPDLLARVQLSAEDRRLLDAFMRDWRAGQG